MVEGAPDQRLLVSAAADLADEIGFENLTLAALAKRFGVRDGLAAHLAASPASTPGASFPTGPPQPSPPGSDSP